jgi:AraC-like DNA-binding protein
MKFPDKNSAPLELLGVAHYHQKAGCHPNGREIPAGQELVEVVTGGRGWVENDGDWVEVGPGDMLWHVEGERTISRSDFDNPYRCLAVRLRVSIGKGRTVEHLRKWQDLESLWAFTDEAVRLYLDEHIERMGLMMYLYGRLRIEASRPHGAANLESCPVSVSEVLQIIKLRYSEPWTVEKLAAEAGYSAAHLHELFRNYVHKTPHDCLTERRLQAARERLAMSNDPVKRIAVECGFTHAAAFCHAFKRHQGEAPGAFRKRQRSTWMG